MNWLKEYINYHLYPIDFDVFDDVINYRFPNLTQDQFHEAITALDLDEINNFDRLCWKILEEYYNIPEYIEIDEENFDSKTLTLVLTENVEDIEEVDELVKNLQSDGWNITNLDDFYEEVDEDSKQNRKINLLREIRSLADEDKLEEIIDLLKTNNI